MKNDRFWICYPASVISNLLREETGPFPQERYSSLLSHQGPHRGQTFS
jgi:hypothetical protein